MSAHICGNSGSVLAVVPMSSTSTPAHAQPDDGTGRRHPVVGVGPPHPAVQRLGGDHQAVGRLLALPAEAVDLGGQRGQPVGFVAAKMRDAAQLRHRTRGGQRGQRRHRRCQLADLVQVDVEAAVGLRTLHLQVGITMADNRTQLLQDCQDGVGGLHAGRRPPRHAHGSAADHRGRQERHRVGEVGLDVPVPWLRSGRGRPATGWRGCRRRRRLRRAALPPSSPRAAPTAPTRRCARSSARR